MKFYFYLDEEWDVLVDLFYDRDLSAEDNKEEAIEEYEGKEEEIVEKQAAGNWDQDAGNNEEAWEK